MRKSKLFTGNLAETPDSSGDCVKIHHRPAPGNEWFHHPSLENGNHPRGVLCKTSAEGSPTPSGGNDNPLFKSFFWENFFFSFSFFFFS